MGFFRSTKNEESKEDSKLLPKADESIMEELRSIPKYVEKEVPELKRRIIEGNAFFRLLAFLAGLIMLTLSSFNVIFGITGITKADVVISTYTFVYGFIICLLEFDWLFRRNFCSTQLRNATSFYFRVFDFTWGRGSLYFIAGITELSQTSRLDILNSYFTIAIGLMFILGSYTSRGKLKALREKLYDNKMLIRSFNEFSKNQGFLTSDNFANMCGSLGVHMTYHELLVSFENMDKNEDQKITLEEFQAWWEQTGTMNIWLESLV